MDSRHSLLTLFLSSVAFSGCVTNIKTLELSETVSPQDSALLLTARLDKSSTAGSYCELRFTNEKSDEFSLNIDRSSEFHLVKLQPGQYWISKLICGTDSLVELQKNISFKVEQATVTIGPEITLKMGMRTLNYQWGAPRPEVLHRGLSKIGDNNYRFHVPANFEASVQNAWFSQLENLPVSIRAAERDLAEIDFNSMPTFQNCTSQYYLNSPLSAKQMSFVAEFKKGKFSELKDFKPEPATSAEKTRKLCVIEELKKSTPPAVDFKLIAGK